MRRDRLGYFFTFLFVLYMSFVSNPLMSGAITQKMPAELYWFLDYVYIGILPVLAYAMNRTIFRILQDDPYSKKLAAWRALPIHSAHITAGRLIQMLICITGSLVIFFLLTYLFNNELMAQVSLTAYTGFALSWYGYSVIAAVGLIFMNTPTTYLSTLRWKWGFLMYPLLTSRCLTPVELTR